MMANIQHRSAHHLTMTMNRLDVELQSKDSNKTHVKTCYCTITLRNVGKTRKTRLYTESNPSSHTEHLKHVRQQKYGKCNG